MSACGARSRSRFAVELVSSAHVHAEQAARLLEREEVLLRECLRRRHQRALPSRLHGAQETVERDDRLAGPDLALQQPLHRHGTLEVTVDLVDGALLMLCELEREDVAVALDELARRSERRSDLGLAFPPPAREPELQQQKLVERKPAASHLGLGERARAVQRPERVDARGQALRRCFKSAGSGSGSDAGSAAPTISRSFFAARSSLAG